MVMFGFTRQAMSLWWRSRVRRRGLDGVSGPTAERHGMALVTGAGIVERDPARAFYWIRWLPGGDQNVSVFLPGFKAEQLVQLPITSSASASSTEWHARLRYPN